MNPGCLGCCMMFLNMAHIPQDLLHERPPPPQLRPQIDMGGLARAKEGFSHYLGRKLNENCPILRRVPCAHFALWQKRHLRDFDEDRQRMEVIAEMAHFSSEIYTGTGALPLTAPLVGGARMMVLGAGQTAIGGYQVVFEAVTVRASSLAAVMDAPWRELAGHGLRLAVGMRHFGADYGVLLLDCEGKKWLLPLARGEAEAEFGAALGWLDGQAIGTNEDDLDVKAWEFFSQAIPF